jgi:hypothetical protein
VLTPAASSLPHTHTTQLASGKDLPWLPDLLATAGEYLDRLRRGARA